MDGIRADKAAIASAMAEWTEGLEARGAIAGDFPSRRLVLFRQALRVGDCRSRGSGDNCRYRRTSVAEQPHIVCQRIIIRNRGWEIWRPM